MLYVVSPLPVFHEKTEADCVQRSQKTAVCRKQRQDPAEQNGTGW